MQTVRRNVAHQRRQVCLGIPAQVAKDETQGICHLGIAVDPHRLHDPVPAFEQAR